MEDREGTLPGRDGPDGFAFQVRSSGEVAITHHGRMATLLRGERARRFLESIHDADPEAAMALMARITGNYRRGNERTAQRHRRNRTG